MGDPLKQIIVNVYLKKEYVFIFVSILLLLVFLPTSIVLYLGALAVFLGGLIVLYVTYLKPKKSNTTSTTTQESGVKKEEVFYIANNIFSYKEAPKVCSAYNSRLATYDDMVTAYQSGANWCSYGWTTGQNVFFPTQQATIDKLSTVPGHERSCGHVGVNGGYIEDPAKKFGVNCYGVKPTQTPEEVTLMDILSKLFSTKTGDDGDNSDPAIDKLDTSSWLIFPFDKSRWTKYIRV